MTFTSPSIADIMTGHARSYGRTWAERTFAKMVRTRKTLPPWPASYGGTIQAQARQVVVGISELTEQGQRQVRACYDAALERYEQLRAEHMAKAGK